MKEFFGLAFSLAAFTAIFAALLFSPGCQYSEGERIGTITKISKKGLFFKTWEGEMSIRLSQGTMVNEKFIFSVRKDEVVKKIQDTLKSGQICTVKYNQNSFQGEAISDTSYEIIDIIVDADVLSK